MTSEVMVLVTSGAHSPDMKRFLLALVLVPFTVFSLGVVFRQGFFGFLTLAWHEPWGMQIFLDLCIALFLVSSWIRKDARERGIPSLPYLLAIPFLGSIGALAYLVHREVAAKRASPHALP